MHAFLTSTMFFRCKMASHHHFLLGNLFVFFQSHGDCMLFSLYYTVSETLSFTSLKISQIGSYSKKNVCFIMFLDELTLTTLSSEGHIPDENGSIGLWRIVVVKNLPYKDMRRAGKVPKLLAHRLFPSAL